MYTLSETKLNRLEFDGRFSESKLSDVKHEFKLKDLVHLSMKEVYLSNTELETLQNVTFLYLTFIDL